MAFSVFPTSCAFNYAITQYLTTSEEKPLFRNGFSDTSANNAPRRLAQGQDTQSKTYHSLPLFYSFLLYINMTCLTKILYTLVTLHTKYCRYYFQRLPMDLMNTKACNTEPKEVCNFRNDTSLQDPFDLDHPGQ